MFAFKDKIDLQQKEYNAFLKTLTCDPLNIYIDHSNFVVCSFMENSIGLKRVNG